MKKLLVILLLTISLFSAEANKEVFKVKTVTGKELTFRGTDDGMRISPYEGKIVFLEFWGTWCGPCLLSIPHHQAMQDKYKDKLRIVSVETTPKVTNKELLEFANNPSKGIDMKKVQWYLDNKAKSAEAKAYLSKPVKELDEFRKSGKKITYDMVSSKDGNDLIYYIAQRARWQGGIPFLIAFKPDGSVAEVIQGMPTEDRLQAIINRVLKEEKEKKATK